VFTGCPRSERCHSALGLPRRQIAITNGSVDSEERNESRHPKLSQNPLPVGQRPIIWHTMKYYAHHENHSYPIDVIVAEQEGSMLGGKRWHALFAVFLSQLHSPLRTRQAAR
jgi:hypothetical protein